MNKKSRYVAKICYEIHASILLTVFVASLCSNILRVSAAEDIPEETIVTTEIPAEEEPVMIVIETEDVELETFEDADTFTLDGEYQELVATPAISNEEMELLVRVVMSEGGGIPYEGKRAICECILNRVASPDYPDTITAVINQPDQFWTGNNGEPNPECYQAVNDSLANHMFPDDMFWFQKGKPSYGYECYNDGYHHYSSKTQH